jgi:hypothetical protein
MPVAEMFICFVWNPAVISPGYWFHLSLEWLSYPALNQKGGGRGRRLTSYAGFSGGLKKIKV